MERRSQSNGLSFQESGNKTDDEQGICALDHDQKHLFLAPRDSLLEPWGGAPNQARFCSARSDSACSGISRSWQECFRHRLVATTEQSRTVVLPSAAIGINRNNEHKTALPAARTGDRLHGQAAGAETEGVRWTPVSGSTKVYGKTDLPTRRCRGDRYGTRKPSRRRLRVIELVAQGLTTVQSLSNSASGNLLSGIT